MIDTITIIGGLAITAFLLFLGFTVGGMLERRHFRRIDEREENLTNMIQTQSGQFLSPSRAGRPPQMVCAEMVVASDYFKNFLAKFRKFFGGEMRSYHSLMVRARREALLQLAEQARAQGFNAICNVRLEPADIGGNMGPRGVAMVCIVGTATAYESDLCKPAPVPINSLQKKFGN